MEKAKSPAFLFYSNDFLEDCAELTHEETGQYIKILCHLHQRGRLKEETIIRMIGSPVLPYVKEKFLIDTDGFWYSKTLEETIRKRENYVESRKRNLSGGKNCANHTPSSNSSSSNSVKTISDSYDMPYGRPYDASCDTEDGSHMENEIENIKSGDNIFFRDDKGGMGGEEGQGTRDRGQGTRDAGQRKGGRQGTGESGREIGELGIKAEKELYEKGISSSCGPPLKEVIEHFIANGYSQEEAKEFWDYYEGQGWITGGVRGQPVKNWRAKVDSFIKNGRFYKEGLKHGVSAHRNDFEGGESSSGKDDDGRLKLLVSEAWVRTGTPINK